MNKNKQQLLSQDNLLPYTRSRRSANRKRGRPKTIETGADSLKDLKKDPMVIIVVERQHTCPVADCRQKFLSVSALARHDKRCHGDESVASTTGCDGESKIKNTPLICEYCSKAFTHQGNLRSHLQIHRRGSVYQCDVEGCHKSFTSDVGLRRHTLSHLGIKLFECDVCGERFSCNLSLKEHVSKHENRRPHQCPNCPRAFRHISGFSRHLRTHTDDKPFTCSVCRQSFSQNIYLKSHMRTHTGETPFKCDVCNKRFKHASDRARHRSVHSEEKRYACGLCGTRFTDPSSCRRHVREHSTVKPYVCPLCADAFKRSTQLRNHLIKKHRYDPGSTEITTDTANNITYGVETPTSSDRILTGRHEPMVDQPKPTDPKSVTTDVIHVVLTEKSMLTGNDCVTQDIGKTRPLSTGKMPVSNGAGVLRRVLRNDSGIKVEFVQSPTTSASRKNWSVVGNRKYSIGQLQTPGHDGVINGTVGQINNIIDEMESVVVTEESTDGNKRNSSNSEICEETIPNGCDIDDDDLPELEAGVLSELDVQSFVVFYPTKSRGKISANCPQVADSQHSPINKLDEGILAFSCRGSLDSLLPTEKQLPNLEVMLLNATNGSDWQDSKTGENLVDSETLIENTSNIANQTNNIISDGRNCEVNSFVNYVVSPEKTRELLFNLDTMEWSKCVDWCEGFVRLCSSLKIPLSVRQYQGINEVHKWLHNRLGDPQATNGIDSKNYSLLLDAARALGKIIDTHLDYLFSNVYSSTSKQ